jgi:hypothetical protein
MTTNEQRLINNVIAVLKEKKNEFSALWFNESLEDSVQYEKITITKYGTIIKPIKLIPEGEDLETITALVGEIIERDRLVYIDRQNDIVESYLGEVEDKGKIEI